MFRQPYKHGIKPRIQDCPRGSVRIGGKRTRVQKKFSTPISGDVVVPLKICIIWDEIAVLHWNFGKKSALIILATGIVCAFPWWTYTSPNNRSIPFVGLVQWSTVSRGTATARVTAMTATASRAWACVGSTPSADWTVSRQPSSRWSIPRRCIDVTSELAWTALGD